jgi:hypothetical protein
MACRLHAFLWKVVIQSPESKLGIHEYSFSMVSMSGSKSFASLFTCLCQMFYQSEY